MRTPLALLVSFVLAPLAAGQMVKTVTTDDECFINVEWTWNPETIGAGDEHESANWYVRANVFEEGGVNKVLINALHKSKCHVKPQDPEDRKADIWMAYFNLPAAAAGDTVHVGNAKHRTTKKDHYDNYTVEFRRTGVVANNRILVYGYHSATQGADCGKDHLGTFDGFSPGNVVGQGEWSEWYGAPGGDSVVSAARSRSTPFALETKLTSSAVLESPFDEEGVWIVSCHQYLSSQAPDASYEPSWFILLSEYAFSQGGNNTWIVQARVDPLAGMWTLDAGAPASHQGPLAFDRWVEWRAVLDFDHDTAEVFYDGQSCAPPYSITGGIFGHGAGPLDLAALVLYSPTVDPSSIVYWDDVAIARSGAQAVDVYCSGKANLVCGPAGIAALGVSSSTSSTGFEIASAPVRTHRTGILLYSDRGRWDVPFDGGSLCVRAPLRRSVPVSSGDPAGACSGVFSIDVNAFAAGVLGGSPAAFLRTPGTRITAQWWGRDSQPTGSLLSTAIEFLVGP